MKSPLKTAMRMIVAVAALGIEAAVFVLGGVWSAIAVAAAMTLAAFAVVAARTPTDTENVFDRHKKGAILLATAVGFVLIASCCFAPFAAGLAERLSVHFADADLFEYYTALLSLTFISISVMSVLSDKSVIIYWANVSEDRLIRPTFYCFAAYTYYSIGATVGAGVGVALNHPLMFVAFFAANIVVMILLTVSMVDVYYGRDTKKKKLARTLNPYNSERTTYESKILGLEQNLLRAADEKDVMFLREVYELCITHTGKFDTDIGHEAMSIMASTLNMQTTGAFLRALDRQICSQLSLFPPKPEAYLGGGICIAYDNTLWTTLFSDRAAGFPEQVSVTADGYSSPNAELFAKVLTRRLLLEYTIYAYYFIGNKVRNGQEVDPSQYYMSDNLVNSIYEPKTADGKPLAPERVREVFEYIRQTPCYRPHLLALLIQMMARVVRDSTNWYMNAQLSALPFVEIWAQEHRDMFSEPIDRLLDILQSKPT